MYDVAPSNAPWFEHLTDSVRALGHAADEWRLAAQAAAVDHARADHPGLDTHPGKVLGLPGDGAVGWEARPRPRRPHTAAQSALRRHYSRALSTARRAYEDAARLYASGAAWAVREVQDGRTPSHVEFSLHPAPDGPPVLAPGPHEVDTAALTAARYDQATEVAAAYQRLDGCLYAAELADGIGEQEYVSDHEASTMHDAWSVAEGTADAACAYGQLLERTLRFVLLGPKEHHRQQLVDARAAEQSETGSAP